VSVNGEVRVAIASDDDVVPARAEGRALAGELGFSRTDATLIATAISEVARNILVHAGTGEVKLRPAYEDRRYGVQVEAADSGPGIRDVQSALREGYGTKGGLGLGLPGVNRIMDEFEIDTALGRGTTVRMTMWRPRDELELLRAKRAPRG
jgi:anti-sigma regulatory factor (Ser/Thr protein kinase)